MPGKKTDNLLPIQEVNSRRSREKHKSDSSKGGKASAEARRQKKELRELLEIALETSDSTGMTEAEGITISLIKEARNGNVKAYEVIRDTLGQKPTERIQAKIDLPQFINDLE